ncbi:LOW QUALITY PROTEIN: conserved hypothetical protein, partial [Mycobacterium tuberculosis T46]
MARTDDDSWDLATGVGATATLVAAGRARAARAAQPLIDDPFAEPLVRAVGVEFLTRWATGELDAADVDDPDAAWGLQRMTTELVVRTRYFDQFFLDAAAAGVSASGDPGVGARRTRVPAAMAGGYDGVRGRSASGARVQGSNARRLGCPADRGSADGAGRPASRLARCAAPRRLRCGRAGRVDRRGFVRIPSPGRAESSAGPRHRLERAREPAGPRGLPRFCGSGFRSGGRDDPHRDPRLARAWLSSGHLGTQLCRPPPRGVRLPGQPRMALGGDHHRAAAGRPRSARGARPSRWIGGQTQLLDLCSGV